MEWKKAILFAGGAAGACAVLYYLLKVDSSSSARVVVDRELKDAANVDAKVDTISREQVQQILNEIIQSQAHIKSFMKELTKDLLSTSLSFEETYRRVKEAQPRDPLEKYGLSMMDFDQLLDKHQSDPAVRSAIANLMGAPNLESVNSKRVQDISVKEILDIHQFMLEELEHLVKYFEGVSDKRSYDFRTLTIAAQAIVASKVEARFKVTSEDIETAVLMHHGELVTNEDFSNANMRIQQTMGKLKGANFDA
eukprot:TRINITY_DN71566_c0_g1_i1.p1 TRINITY_DN71566_c0_g1~~TRINITY_DN71566_c0_g1_i1.p1  ORF type:complete len:252 (-),score=60.03 TRINITY_DN71566_c0_g1_i1:211-966(-)